MHNQLYPPIDMTEEFERLKALSSQKAIQQFADKIGVDILSLQMMECIWSNEHFGYGFPMKDKDGMVTGIRFINDSGNKWFAGGSRGASYTVIGSIDSDIEKILKIIHFPYE